MRIGFLSPWPVGDAAAWSGVVKPMYDALASRAHVVPLWSGDIEDGLIDRAYLRLLSDRFGTYLAGHALHTSMRHGRTMGHRVAASGVDVILAVAASQDVAFLPGNVPVVQVSDTTFAAIRDYYPLYSRLSPVLVPQARIQTARSVRRVTATVAASDWARQALMRDDNIPGERIALAPFGPAITPPEQVVRHAIDPERPRILLVASDWERKGGPDALAAFTELRRTVPGATLTVVGDAVPGLPDGAVGLGRVARTRMAEAYAPHDVLLELARSNAAGVTLTDVAGFGLPAVATDIGGVSTVVRNGTSGVLLAPGPHLAERAASAIIRICTTPGLWHHLVQGSFDHARAVLSWDHWADVTLAILGGCAAEHSGDKDGER